MILCSKRSTIFHIFFVEIYFNDLQDPKHRLQINFMNISAVDA